MCAYSYKPPLTPLNMGKLTLHYVMNRIKELIKNIKATVITYFSNNNS
jgi:hypothetical protein